MEQKKLKYEKFNNSDNVIVIDLHNGYSVIAISGWQNEKYGYTTTLFLKNNTVDKLDLVEKAEKLEFHANYKTINSAILKQVSAYLEDGFFDYYIERYEYEMSCFDIGNDIAEKERLSNAS